MLMAVVSGEQVQTDGLHIDEKLFIKIGNGDKSAFETLYLETKGAVYSFALSMLRNHSDAEDAAQETFLKIRSAAHLYTAQGKPMAWILTITRNICLMKFRQQKRMAYEPIEEMEKLCDFDRISDLEDRLVLKSAFKILQPDEIQIIILHAVSGMKHREISELLEIPISTVLSKYHRGLKKLRKELEGKL